MWQYIKVKGRWQSKEIMARQSIGKERTVSYSEMVTSNRGCGAYEKTAKPEPK